MTRRRNPLVTALIWIIVNRSFIGHTLACHPAEYQVDNECCPMCPAGSRVKTDCTEFRSTSCLSCVQQTFLDRPNGLKKCLTCKICNPESGLTIKRACTPTSDAACQPLDGFRCIDLEDGSCAATEKHRSCEPGQYISQKGTADTDTECSPCPDGSFSNGTAPSCQQHTQCEELKLQQIKPGTADADAECREPGTNAAVIAIISIIILLILITIIIVMYKCHIVKGRNKLCSLWKDKVPVEESISMDPESSGKRKMSVDKDVLQ